MACGLGEAKVLSGAAHTREDGTSRAQAATELLHDGIYERRSCWPSAWDASHPQAFNPSVGWVTLQTQPGIHLHRQSRPPFFEAATFFVTMTSPGLKLPRGVNSLLPLSLPHRRLWHLEHQWKMRSLCSLSSVCTSVLNAGPVRP